MLEQAAAQKARVHIRWMIRRDMPEVLQIEQHTAKAPWTEEDFLRGLRQRNCIGMVAEHGEKVVGFYIYQLLKASIYLTNMAVHPAWQRQSVGSQMIVKLIGKLTEHRRRGIVADVRETNMAALLFLKRHGFLAAGVTRHFYDDTDEDAIVMRRAISTPQPEDEAEAAVE